MSYTQILYPPLRQLHNEGAQLVEVLPPAALQASEPTMKTPP